MGAAMGRESDAVAFLDSLADAPYRHDFYQALRRLDTRTARRTTIPATSP